jgi:DNA transformation protein and related proteins
MADVDHLTELLAPLGGVSFKRMFSGHGIMKEGVMFALIARDVLYFRTDDKSVVRHQAEGAPQWQPHMRGKTMTTMPYWQVPERLYDEPDEFAEWARDAFAAAVRNKTEKAKKKPAHRKPAAGNSTARSKAVAAAKGSKRGAGAGRKVR